MSLSLRARPSSAGDEKEKDPLYVIAAAYDNLNGAVTDYKANAPAEPSTAPTSF